MTRAQREEIERKLEACSAAARALFERHAPERFTRRPRLGSWSAAECVAHLSLTAAAMLPPLEAALRDLREGGERRESPSGMDWSGRLLSWSLEPRWLRMRTIPRFQPVEPGPADQVLPSFMRHQDAIVRALRSAEGLDLEAARITSPFGERVRYNLFSAFRILETHERRHLRQAEAAASAG